MTRRMLARILAGALTGTKKLLSPSVQRRTNASGPPPLILHVDRTEGEKIHSRGVSLEATHAIFRHFSLPENTPTLYVLRGYDPRYPRPVRRLEAHLVQFKTPSNAILIKAYI